MICGIIQQNEHISYQTDTDLPAVEMQMMYDIENIVSMNDIKLTTN